MSFNWSRTQSQGDATGKQFLYDVDAAHATLLAPGDVMRISGTASADGTPQIDSSGAGVAITGILLSVAPQFAGEALSETGLPATTGGSVLVNVDPNSLWEVDVVNGPLVVANVGLNADTDAAVATTAGGLSISNMALDAGTVAGTDTLQFRIVALVQDPLSGIADGTRALVRFNNSTLNTGTTGV